MFGLERLKDGESTEIGSSPTKQMIHFFFFRPNLSRSWPLHSPPPGAFFCPAVRAAFSASLSSLGPEP